MNEDKRNLISLLLRLGSVLTGLLGWHYLAEAVINDSGILVSPLVVVSKAYEMMITTGELYPHLFASSIIFFYGFVLAVIVGVPLGFVMALSPLVRDYVNPWMTTLYTAPRIAFAPVLLLWFGIGAGSKVAIVFLGCVFPVLINSYYGMRVVNREYVELARSYRLDRWALFRKILLPASVPFILAGVRLAIGRGLVGMIVAEFYTSVTGLGYMIVRYANALETDKLFVPIVVVMLLGVGLMSLAKWIEGRIAPWRNAIEKD